VTRVVPYGTVCIYTIQISAFIIALFVLICMNMGCANM